MNKILLFAILFTATINAQSHRFLYEYSFKRDSLNKDSVSTKLMRLNITKEFSEFLSEKKAKSDSVTLQNIGLSKQFDIAFSANQLSTESFTDYKTGETLVYGQIGIQEMKVKLKNLPKWTLAGETKKINGYNCQKATTDYGGRKWIVWFTNEIPFQEGPYIFKGLPGLVVQVQDTSDNHRFSLAGNHKSENSKSNRFTTGEVITVEEKKFKQAWKKFREHPIPMMRQMQNKGVIFTDGADISSIGTDETNHIRKVMAANNNAILLNLYQ